MDTLFFDIPFTKPRKTKFKFIDLFAGIGGIRIPFQELGGKCVLTSEWDKFAQKTYRTNFGDEPRGDIHEDEKYTISQKLYEGHLRRKAEHIKKGNGFGFSVFNADSEYVNTISARYYKDGSEVMIDQGPEKNPRKLTPRECARLQGFPEKFIIPVSDTQAYKQFGNSVAVPVIRAIAKKMVSEIKILSKS